MIASEGIDFYRSDFNIDPLPFWRAADAEDRQGITEIRYVEGYLAYWDELRRRHPGMLIDSCASGGRRNDLETMRRAVPLLRTDFEGNPEGNQCHTYGFGLWLPYFNAVHNWSESPYRFRSSIAPFVQRNWDVRTAEFNVRLAQDFLGQWQQRGGLLLRRFLSAQRVQHGRRCLDGLAVPSPRSGRQGSCRRSGVATARTYPRSTTCAGWSRTRRMSCRMWIRN